MARRNNLGERKAPACLVRPYSLKAAANPLDSHTLVLSSGRHFGGYRYPPAFIQRACCEIALITSIKEISITSFPSLMQTLQCNYLWGRSLFFRSAFDGSGWDHPMDRPRLDWLSCFEIILVQSSSSSLLLAHRTTPRFSLMLATDFMQVPTSSSLKIICRSLRREISNFQESRHRRIFFLYNFCRFLQSKLT